MRRIERDERAKEVKLEEAESGNENEKLTSREVCEV